MKRVILKVDGMMCGMCEAHVNDAVRKAADVKKVESSHTKCTTEVVCDDAVDPQVLKDAIEREGYNVSDISEEQVKESGLFSKLFKKKTDV